MKLLILLSVLAAPPTTPPEPVIGREGLGRPAPPAPLPAPSAQPVPGPDRAGRPLPAASSNTIAPRAASSAFGVIGGKHDLSITGPGPFKSDTESNACAFCHVPHGTDRIDGRPASTTLITPYASSTFTARAPAKPTGSSRICLSCHDGTIALGQTRTRLIQMRDNAPGGKLPPGHPANLGTDLRGTHPISFKPAAGKASTLPPDGDAVRLDKEGRLQCMACHDPHREQLPGSKEGKFLVKTMGRSALCVTCHDASRLEAPDAAHAISTTTIVDPNTGRATTLAELRCATCHVPHNGDKRGRLVRPSDKGDDAMCLRCHDGKTAKLDVASVVARPYAHAASTTAPTVHDLAEGPGKKPPLPETVASAERHVTCVDCHEPHQAAAVRAAVAPAIKASMTGAAGIDRSGARVSPAKFEYEVCFKCHADSLNQPQARGLQGAGAPRRGVVQVNLRRVFEPSGPSAHPVIGPGRNPQVPGLVAPLTASSVIYCTDCHASNDGKAAGGSGPRGPHGSTYRYLLERNYSTTDGTAESPEAYALCYKCHARETLLSTRSSFPPHQSHVAPGATAKLATATGTPCAVCHNAHGISSLVGTANGNAHLIDFDLNVVKPLPGEAAPRYTAGGARGGTCALVCHGQTHNPLSY